MPPIRVGVIDIGSNSIKLLIAENSIGNEIQQILFSVEEVRIGEGMTESPPAIDTKAIVAGTNAVSRLYAKASDYHLHRLVVVATSAVRDAQNREEFIHSIRSSIGIELKVLSGRDEARMIGKGVQQDPALASLKNFTLADLGGGSLECIQFLNKIPIESQSFNLGAVRLASMYIKDRMSPVRSNEWSDIENSVKSTLVNSPIVPDTRNTATILMGGSTTILRNLISDYKSDMPAIPKTVRAIRDEVCSLSYQKRIDLMKIPHKRADIFPAATIILCELLDFLGSESIYFSLYNLRFGLAAELIEEQRSTDI